jgi:drug/metabolite transporter (DMT)-like permease
MNQSDRESLPGDAGGIAASSNRSLTLVVFVVTAVMAGGNAVAIKISNVELAPFWGAAVRFLAASVLLFAAVTVMRLSLPRGRALLGVLLYGLFSFGSAFGFIYWALIEVTAGTAMVGLATVPMLTLMFAVIVGIERFTFRGVAGATIAAVGIVIVFSDAIATASPASMVALLCGAASLAASPVIVKTFPKVHPVSQNAVGMLAGSIVLFAASMVMAETWAFPMETRTQVALVYLVVLGSVSLFLLYLFLIARMTASGANYIMLLAPLSAVVLGALLLEETISLLFAFGGVLVIVGVYTGAIMRSGGR